MSSHEFDTEISLDCIKVRIKVSSYTPERPAPSCQNPDSPLYSDSGDPEESEWYAFFIFKKIKKVDGKEKEVIVEVPVPYELYELIADDVDEQVREEFRDIIEDAKDSAAEAAYEARIERDREW